MYYSTNNRILIFEVFYFLATVYFPSFSSLFLLNSGLEILINPKYDVQIYKHLIFLVGWLVC